MHSGPGPNFANYVRTLLPESYAPKMTDRQCPRCGENLPPQRWTGRGGRPQIWCSQRCRRAAYEERRAAANGAIAVRLEVIEKPVERIIERVRVEKQIEIRPQKVDAVVAAQIVLRSPRATSKAPTNTSGGTGTRGGLPRASLPRREVSTSTTEAAPLGKARKTKTQPRTNSRSTSNSPVT